MNLSEKFMVNLLQRAYSYVDGGALEWDDWSQKMKAFLEASNNDLLSLSDHEILEIIHTVWEEEYEIGGEIHRIREWARIKGEKTIYQTEMRNAIDRLFEAIELFRSSTFFIELLEFCARFKLLAPYNAMMVKVQMPAARYVLTAKNWDKMYDRKPKRNARPLVILRKYGPIDYVFEIADTEPIPGRMSLMSDDDILATLADPYAVTGDIDVDVYDNLTHAVSYYGIELDTFRVAADFGAEIRKTPCKVNVNGVEADGHYVISVNEKASRATSFASICHELGHFFCHHLSAPNLGGDDWWKCRKVSWREEEFEAEIVSYIICERYGVGNKSYEYLSRVLGENGTIPQGISIDKIFKAANEVERMLKPDLDPRTCILYKNDKDFKRRFDKAFPKRITSVEEIEEE